MVLYKTIMTHVTSYALPFLVLGIVFFGVYYHIDLGAYVPILAAIGVGGIPLSILKAAVAAQNTPAVQNSVASSLDSAIKALSDAKTALANVPPVTKQ